MRGYPARRVAGGLVSVLPGGVCTIVAPTEASPVISVDRNGGLRTINANTASFQHWWYRGGHALIGDGYWVRATRVSGDATDFIGPVNTWININQAVIFAYTPPAGTTRSGTYTIQIATSSGGTPIVAASAPGAYSLSGTDT